MSHRLRPLIATLATIGAVTGGGAAIASAATSTSTTTGTTTTHTSTTGSGAHSTAPHSATGKRNCPNM